MAEHQTLVGGILGLMMLARYIKSLSWRGRKVILFMLAGILSSVALFIGFMNTLPMISLIAFLAMIVSFFVGIIKLRKIEKELKN